MKNIFLCDNLAARSAHFVVAASLSTCKALRACRAAIKNHLLNKIFYNASIFIEFPIKFNYGIYRYLKRIIKWKKFKSNQICKSYRRKAKSSFWMVKSKSKPAYDNLKTICQALNISAAYLLGLEQIMKFKILK